MSYIENYYNNYDEEKRLTTKSHLPEYLITMKYIEKYLKPDSKIIEIGAGTGRYSIELAKRGYDVTAVELVEHNIDIMKRKVKPEYNIKIHKGNAVDLSFINDEEYDIVLVLGPMYHLFNYEDKHKAISEALRVAKRNAVVFVSYCNSDASIYRLIVNGEISDYIDKVDETFHAKSMPEMVFELYRKEDVDRIMYSFKVQRLHYVGVNMLSLLFTDKLNNLSEEDFDIYMKYLYTICEDEDKIGFSFHILDIFRKDADK